jgi:hypothetical protein
VAVPSPAPTSSVGITHAPAKQTAYANITGLLDAPPTPTSNHGYGYGHTPTPAHPTTGPTTTASSTSSPPPATSRPSSMSGPGSGMGVMTPSSAASTMYANTAFAIDYGLQRPLSNNATIGAPTVPASPGGIGSPVPPTQQQQQQQGSRPPAGASMYANAGFGVTFR